MALSEEQAEELADLLPDGLSCGNARERLLCIVEMLRVLTDAEHTLSNADIRAVLRARFGSSCTPAENTIGADLRSIRDSGCLGIDVHITPSGAWCENRALDTGKVRLLLNAVQSSRFLTAEQSADLQESLFDLVSRFQEESLEGEVLVDQRVRKSQQAVFDACDAILLAIRMKRKVEFVYTYNDFRGKPMPLQGDSGQIIRVETPIALLFSEGNYYLESYAETPWRHDQHVMRSRVDRMYDVHPSGEKADDGEEVQRAKREAKARLRRSFNMVGGTSRIVFLRVRADYTNVMLDHFGYQLKYAQFHGPMGDVETTALTCVCVAQSFTFFRWLSSAGDGIVISAPPDAFALSSSPWKKMLEGIEHGRLVQDYEAMVQGYLEFLEKAGRAYR